MMRRTESVGINFKSAVVLCSVLYKYIHADGWRNGSLISVSTRQRVCAGTDRAVRRSDAGESGEKLSLPLMRDG
jgi:hypothetical protein